MIGFSLAVASALCWSGLDVVRKALAGKASPTALAVFLLLGQLPFLGAWAVADRTWVTESSYWPPAIASMAMNALANVLFMRSLQLSPLSRTVPLLSLTPVFSAWVAIPALGEIPTARHWAAILLVVGGALLLNSDRSTRWWRAVTHERGAPHMVGVAALWALSTALDKRALPHASPASHSFLLSMGSGVILGLWIHARREHDELYQLLEAPKALLVAMIALAVSAVALQMLSLVYLWVAVLETIKRAVGVIGGVVMARVFFREPITVRMIVAILLMILGTTLLGISHLNPLRV